MTSQQATDLIAVAKLQAEAMHAQGTMLARLEYWAIVGTQLLLILIFFAAMKRWGK